MPTVAEIADFLNQFAPTERAADWDNVGLILGERATAVNRAHTCLTVTPEVVVEAISSKANLIVTHHPMLFRPVQRITDQTPDGKMVLALLRAGVAVYSPHTAFDNCAGGINDLLAQKLGLQDVRCLRPYDAAPKCKVVVFVPDSDLGRVSDAMFTAGAGVIGQYSQCSFRLAGIGTFFGSDAANPTIGEKGRREEVNEWRLEAVCPEAALNAVVAAMRKAHSYEEPAYDIYPLRAVGEQRGEGRIGRLASPVPLEDLARRVRTLLDCGPVQVVGDAPREVRVIALACGAAGEFLHDAVRSSADLFLTGEMRFHDYLAAKAVGMALVLPGHYASERLGIEALAKQLRKQFRQLEVAVSHTEKDPVTWI